MSNGNKRSEDDKRIDAFLTGQKGAAKTSTPGEALLDKKIDAFLGEVTSGGGTTARIESEPTKDSTAAIKQFGRGALSGATFEVAGKTEEELAGLGKGSVTERARLRPGPLGFGTARGTGQLVGFMAPLIASEMIAGVALPTIVAKFGLDAVRQSVARGILTGVIFEGAEGAASRRSPFETLKSMVKTAAEFGIISRIGVTLGKWRKFLGVEQPERTAEQFAVTPAKIRAARFKAGKTTVGENILNKPEQSTKVEPLLIETRDDLQRLQNKKNFMFEGFEAESKPLTAQPEVPPAIEVGRTPVSTPRPAPPLKESPRTPVSGPGQPVPIQGSRDALGVQRTQDVTEGVGGMRRANLPQGERVVIPGSRDALGVPRTGDVLPSGGGRIMETSTLEGTGPGAFEKDALGATTRTAGEKIGGKTVDLKGVNKSIDNLAGKKDLTQIGTDGETIRNIRDEFLKGRDIVTISKADAIRSELDSQVRGFYFKELNESSTRTQAKQVIADFLRDEIAKASPKVGAVNKELSASLDIEAALERVQSGGAKTEDIGLRSIADFIFRRNLGLARFFRKKLGKPTKIIAPTVRRLSQRGVTNDKFSILSPIVGTANITKDVLGSIFSPSEDQ